MHKMGELEIEHFKNIDKILKKESIVMFINMAAAGLILYLLGINVFG